MPKNRQLSEKLLQWVWENQKVGANCNMPLQTTDGIKIEILSPGILSLDDGPDFRNAQVKFNDNVLRGDIEVHLLSSDWFTHSHQVDPKYNNVLLHVVWHHNFRDAVTQQMKTIPTLTLSKYVTKSFAELLKEYKKAIRAKQGYKCRYAKNYSRVTAILEIEGINRFNDRKQKFSELIKLYGVEQSAYIGVMESLGYVKNESPFVRLAHLVPIEKLYPLIAHLPRKDKVKFIKLSLFGVADLLPRKFRTRWNKIKSEFNETMKEEEWQFFKVRPTAFPTRRIEGISYFLADTIEEGIYNSFKLALQDLNRLENILAQGGISKSCARTTILNVYLPLLAAYEGQDKSYPYETEAFQIYRSYKKLPDNSITKFMSKILLRNKKKFKNEIYYQGMLRIFHHYCHNMQCDACSIKILEI